jgi:hypothetical protein
MRTISFRMLMPLLLLFVLSIHAQKPKPGEPKPQELLRHVPSAVDHHAMALGDRVRVAGREKTVLTGDFVDENGKSTSVRLTLQLPGLMRLEGLTRAAQNKRLEEVIRETFTTDTAEGMLVSIKEGAAVQVLGRRVRPDSSRRGAENSRVQDVYEVSAKRLKRYFFDSETGLLSRTEYVDESISPPMNVETRFADWRRVEGSSYPGKIERFENGHAAFSLTVTAIAASPRQDPESFR